MRLRRLACGSAVVLPTRLSGDPLGVMHQSYKGVFAAFRSRPRRAPMIRNGDQSLHSSVVERQKARPHQRLRVLADKAPRG